MTYTEVTFTIEPYAEAIADALMAELGTIGYDGFPTQKTDLQHTFLPMPTAGKQLPKFNYYNTFQSVSIYP